LPHFQELFGDGKNWGLSLSYAAQSSPNGIAEAFIIGQNFIQNSPVALVLGDNIFWGQAFSPALHRAKELSHTCTTIFAYQVKNPRQFGVVGFDKDSHAVYLEEKPTHPKS